jgi:hypothetical protein
MAWRYDMLSAAMGEFGTLDRAHVYIRTYQRMRLHLRKASFTWKADQLAFVEATANFYADYGAVLRLLKTEETRGRFQADRPATVVKQGV